MARVSELLYFKGHTYQVLFTAMSWNTAAFTARDLGGHLASIGDAAENAAVFGLAHAAYAAYAAARSVPYAPDGGDGSYVWLGARDSAEEGVWRWQDGSLTGYANWGAGSGVTEPDDYDGAQDHLGLSLNGWPFPASAIGAAGEWNDISGSNALWSVVEWDGLRGDAGNNRFAGTARAETFWGEGGDDLILGAGGADRIMGGAGADLLGGGRGADTLAGGRGADVLSGGAGADVFVFEQLDAGRGAARRDVITDFAPLQDKIDLSAIDANVDTGAVDALIWGGTTATPHGIWARTTAEGVQLLGDTTGDGRADFEIWLQGLATLPEGALIL